MVNITFAIDNLFNYCYLTCSNVHSDICYPFTVRPLPPPKFDELEPPVKIDNKEA